MRSSSSSEGYDKKNIGRIERSKASTNLTQMKEKKLFENITISKVSLISPQKSVRPRRQLQKQASQMSLNIMESVTKLHKEKVDEDEKHRKVILEKLAYALAGKPL